MPSHTVHRARRLLARLAPGAGLQAVLVSALNGGEIVRLSTRPDRVDGRGLAAMAGSMMAMARAVGREVQWPACRRLTFETQEGMAVFQAIEGPVPCVLCLLHDSRAPLERVLWLATEVARALESP
ncbi:MAG: roadblock/LC7 domain-containing protein [Burkholderiaceae bacterium]|nr:MAG: roadblock/LC7 domain-containing protein [Burkholderiaceae bacterium]